MSTLSWVCDTELARPGLLGDEPPTPHACMGTREFWAEQNLARD